MIWEWLSLYWEPVVEIAVLWFMIYHVMLFFVGSRAVNALRGIIILLLAFLLFHKLDFEVIDWLLTKLFGLSVIAVLIIFHPEIRQGLARLGERHRIVSAFKEKEIDELLREISKSVESMTKDKIGALIAIENKDPLASYAESGVVLQAKVNADLIQAVFTPPNPLHDGGMIIHQGRILAAGCLFPLTEKPDLSRIFGTRHRAALGLSEETDAVIIVVSEERQDMSLVHKGRLLKDLGKEEIILKTRELLRSRNNG